MNEKTSIRSCIIDGRPLSLDKKSCEKKDADDRKIKGDADVLLFIPSYSITWQF